jgi:fused signal recognition particle receptor
MPDAGPLDSLRALIGDAGLGALALALLAAVAHGASRLRRKPAVPPAPSQQVPAPRAEAAVPVSPTPGEPVVAQPALSPERATAAISREPAVEAPHELAPAPPPRASLRERLARTQAALIGRALQLVGARTLDAGLEGELEALLFTADLGVKTAEDLLSRVKKEAAGGSAEQVRAALRGAIAEKLRRVEPKCEALATSAKPHVIVVLGVNGSGKTTTIGKLAARYRAAGKTVLLGAGDTFRAAAREQLQTWGQRAGCEVIAGPDGGDPAAVAFDSVKAAVARGVDVAIVDTAGRLQTKAPLMQELAKIVRIVGRECPGAPHETLLVLDANTGQNAISQAREFTQAAGVTGIVLTKLDGTAKGGVIVGLADEFGIPVKYVGVGEGVEDLRDFSADEFVDALFAD